jgi:NADH-quinone oxidoreductase subunit J
MRVLVAALAASLALGAVMATAAPGAALAQTITADEVPDDVEVQPVARIPSPQPGKGQAVFFWLFALLTIGGAIMTITRRNLVTAVMFLVGTFLGIAALYVLLYAHFLAVIQVLVYAGAIMVLFVFVVMILNKAEEEPWALRGIVGKVIAGAALAYLLFRLVQVLWRAPQLEALREPATMPADYGTTVALAETLFTTYLFPFEAVSIVLLIAVVGALVLAHPSHPNVGEEELS